VTVTNSKPGGTAASAAIEVSGLRKSFGDHVVLNGVDLSVPEGSVFALLGPNGAGKTTMVRILATLSAADAGQVRVAGHDIANMRQLKLVNGALGVGDIAAFRVARRRAFDGPGDARRSCGWCQLH